MADFKALHSRSNDGRATALAFDLLMFDGDDLRLKPYVERKAALRKMLRGDRGIEYVEHAEGHGEKFFDAACELGLEGTVSKKLDAPYRSGKSKAWIKVKNPKAPAATRTIDGTFHSYFLHFRSPCTSFSRSSSGSTSPSLQRSARVSTAPS